MPENVPFGKATTLSPGRIRLRTRSRPACPRHHRCKRSSYPQLAQHQLGFDHATQHICLHVIGNASLGETLNTRGSVLPGPELAANVSGISSCGNTVMGIPSGSRLFVTRLMRLHETRTLKYKIHSSSGLGRAGQVPRSSFGSSTYWMAQDKIVRTVLNRAARRLRPGAIVMRPDRSGGTEPDRRLCRPAPPDDRAWQKSADSRDRRTRSSHD